MWHCIFTINSSSNNSIAKVLTARKAPTNEKFFHTCSSHGCYRQHQISSHYLIMFLKGKRTMPMSYEDV
ncbi:CLUMA_CG000674, isoform A [Clunio marinus]|uniref:CLUMA_CG000674, isoform A n=1 Tax=Clunio marinus TaxID=568069 RepID=A0A1J1HFU7_9DIPT|nr:CLUMA_CG000674, isoform A [Clunio marinus]